MKKYTYSFTGRQTGAIGITYKITHTYEANSLEDANTILYTDYEIFHGLRVNGKHLPFDKIKFSDTKPTVSLNRK
jgi:hypothetical protein